MIAVFVVGCRTENATGNVVFDGSVVDGSAQEQDEGYKVTCSKDSDCGQIEYGEKYCFQGGVVTPIVENICENPASVKSYCRREMADEVLMCEKGREICRDGSCLVLANLLCTDSDGGKNYEKAGTVFDAELIEYRDNCLDKYHVIEYYCSGGTKGIAKKEEVFCHGQCVTGACVEKD